jgi:hypothetical protein
VLAVWQYGLGRSLAWTPDAQGDWSKDWVGTDQFKKLWPQAVRWTMPAPVDPGTQISIRGDGEVAHVRVEAFEPTGEFRDRLATVADVVRADEASGRRIPLPQTAPGRYEGQFGLSGPGVYFVHVTQTDAQGQVVSDQTTGYALPQLPEVQLTPANRVLMERLAADTGGPALNKPEEAWRRDTQHGWQPQEVWNELLAAALALFVLDVAARRMRLSLADVRVLRSGARRLSRARIWHWRPPRLSLHPLQGARRAK